MYSTPVYFCLVFLISSASVGPYYVFLYCAHLCMKCSLGISSFLAETSSLSNSIVFLYFFALWVRNTFLYLLTILWNSAFRWICLSFSPLPLASLFSSAVCKSSSDNRFPFLHFFSFGMILITVTCTMSWTSVHSFQALCLSDLIPWIYLSLPLYNCKGFDLGHIWMV